VIEPAMQVTQSPPIEIVSALSSTTTSTKPSRPTSRPWLARYRVPMAAS
jgi:hypothetical protein